MTIQLALDKDTGDLILKEGGGVERVNDARFVVQQVQSRLRTWVGEWLLDREIGWLSPSDFERNPDLFDIERRAINTILTTTGVKEILSLNLELKQRRLLLTFRAITDYGVFDLTVPWGIVDGRS